MPEDSFTLQVLYVGYSSIEIPIEAGSEDIEHLEFKLSSGIVLGEMVVLDKSYKVMNASEGIRIGLQTDPKDDWTSPLFYPFVKSKKDRSEIGKNFMREMTTTLEAIEKDVGAVTYLWCRCGFSKNQPFCDGSHHGTKYKPFAFEVKKKRNLRLCNCKHTKMGPFCDNTFGVGD